MASLNLTQDEFRAIEQTRQRLSQISSSIASLKSDVFINNPLPSLESLQTHTEVLQSMIQSLLSVTSPAAEIFSRIAVHPSTNFPGRTQEMILQRLLRKKPEPDIATSMDEGRNMVAAFAPQPSSQGLIGAGTGIEKGPEEELGNIWDSVRNFCEERMRDYVINEGDDMFTEEERERGVENVRTGLKRSFEDEEEDDDEDDEEGGGTNEDQDDDVMIIDRPPPPPAPAVVTQEIEGAALENIMRFAARGEFVTR
ncbi:mediator of RNA polymerase II transcription complex subunit 8-domain-containing protein [Daldinia decipiens]|uniref:mediator of RNA polymerase II transcription complex subunit 8-domain-containing protein n=1 Tax=Daldinia decipiens TaxID=326647 RepID=UPI0020C2500E|nr:mediator of RNA polymerase II transcription complex subunit 8-domain-containing protein [Daldinia decipiens]KAI1655304.1 mediator of RNA polymerase II transcription complex subunit 8-domain-containing protein [Daldinia decipiens]